MVVLNAYFLKSHGGVRGFYASLWRFLLRCILFSHSAATFLPLCYLMRAVADLRFSKYLFYYSQKYDVSVPIPQEEK